MPRTRISTTGLDPVIVNQITVAYTAAAGGGSGGGAGGKSGVGILEGTVNTGGGGGGFGSTSSSGAAGGSGIVIIGYMSSVQRGTGGTITSYTAGGNTYWVHTFATSGTFTA